jgi:hypothetical protein
MTQTTKCNIIVANKLYAFLIKTALDDAIIATNNECKYLQVVAILLGQVQAHMHGSH